MASMKYSTVILISLLSCSLPLPRLFAEPEWKLVTTTDDIKVWTREKEGTSIKEVKTTGLIDARSWRVLKVISDHDHYSEFMPYTKESRILEKNGNVVYFYTRVAPPLISERDYTIKLVSTAIPGKSGHFVTEFSQANSKGPSGKKGVVRVETVSGYWRLEPAEGGEKTSLTYYVFTSPGGAVPGNLANKANTQTVPGIIKAVRERVRLKQYACQNGTESDCEDWMEIAK